MTQTLVHRLFEIIDSEKWEQFPEVFHPDVRYERPGHPTVAGLPQLDHFYRKERVIAGQHHLDAVVISETHAACWGRFVGQHRNGKHIDEEFADVYVLENDRIRTRKSFFKPPA